jgi:hypothetical protein
MVSPDFGKRQSNVTPSIEGSERRQQHRQAATANAIIILPDGRMVKCALLNASRSGALLLVTSVLGIPQRFVVRDDNGRNRTVEVVRRERGRLGVRFL